MSSFKDVLKKAKTKGYWKLIVEPTVKIDNFFSHPVDAKEYVNDKKVSLRGWDYPHYPTKRDNFEGWEVQSDRTNVFIDWNHFVEVWTFFQSGQFAHILGLREDWLCDSDWFSDDHLFKKVKSQTVVDFVWSTLTLTEMLLFVKNLSEDKRYTGKIHVEISLHNVMDRRLFTFDPSRIPIFQSRTSSSVNISLLNKDFETSEINSNYLQIARDCAVCLFKYFDWPDPPVNVIEQDQQKLLSRTI